MANSPDINLSEFQKWMQQQLLDPFGQLKGTEAAEGIPDFEVEDLINPSQKLAAKAHLAIYQRGYIARLRDCMAKQFPTLEYALGPQLFQAFADEYLSVYPSNSYNLSNLGDRFADYLSETRPDKEATEKEDWPDFMIELAHFENTLNQAFDEKLSDFHLAQHSTKESNLALIPGFYLFAFQFPIRWYYNAFANEESPALPHPYTTYCAALRKDYTLKLYDLNEAQYYLLSYLKKGASISDAKAQLFQAFDIDLQELEEVWPIWKARWVELGFFKILY